MQPNLFRCVKEIPPLAWWDLDGLGLETLSVVRFRHGVSRRKIDRY